MCIAVTREVQYLDDPLAEARSFLEVRGLVFGIHFVESNAIALAGELLLTEGFGPATFEFKAA